MASWIPFSMRYFPMGKYLSSEARPSQEHLFAQPPITTETARLIELTPEQKTALQNKISKLDAAMYYDQLASTFIISILKGVKEINLIEKNSTAGMAIDWIVYGLPAAITFANSAMKYARDNAAKTLNPAVKVLSTLFSFKLGNYIAPQTPTIVQPYEEAPPPLPVNDQATKDKISKLDDAMFYDQLALTFVVTLLKGAKEINLIEKSSIAGITIDWLVYGLPPAITFINGVLKNERDKAAKELNPTPSPRPL